jgi:hypothetical protein
MIRPDIEPVYLPPNELYLGQPHLLAFDKAIPAAMRTKLKVARRTFVKPLSPLQIAASEIIPQGISIALSIRELIRQAYLYSAAPDPAAHRARQLTAAEWAVLGSRIVISTPARGGRRFTP